MKLEGKSPGLLDKTDEAVVKAQLGGMSKRADGILSFLISH
jgi:hypothetical protein